MMEVQGLSILDFGLRILDVPILDFGLRISDLKKMNRFRDSGIEGLKD